MYKNNVIHHEYVSERRKRFIRKFVMWENMYCIAPQKVPA